MEFIFFYKRIIIDINSIFDKKFLWSNDDEAFFEEKYNGRMTIGIKV